MNADGQIRSKKKSAVACTNPNCTCPECECGSSCNCGPNSNRSIINASDSKVLQKSEDSVPEKVIMAKMSGTPCNNPNCPCGEECECGANCDCSIDQGRNSSDSADMLKAMLGYASALEKSKAEKTPSKGNPRNDCESS